MKNDVESCLLLDGSLTGDAIEHIVRYNVKNLCLTEPERQSIIKLSEILTPHFLKIVNTYLEMEDRPDSDYFEASLIAAADCFLANLKLLVLKHRHNRPVSTGLLFTWIPIVMMLNQSAGDIQTLEFQPAITYLEAEVHKFALAHLHIELNEQAGKFYKDGGHYHSLYSSAFDDGEMQNQSPYENCC